MENPILKNDLRFHWELNKWFNKKQWYVIILDKTHIWRRSGVCQTEEEGKEKIKECINNFKKVY